MIVDVTNLKSSPLELQATVPAYQVPYVSIIQEGEKPFAMMRDLKKYGWVLDTIKKRDELRLIKAKEPIIISGRELRDKGKL